ncbi:20267_t:CDS:2 [Cetraspora pellucida]|uniref:20267_t:CDS:1 n=1 Tax=Cetraspora pellucida TaxID=1433469 RepID=A0A9N9N8J0_9GLOM|nr:20267_t:CDS:2 [Cetraspora pellucida]
MKKLRRSTRKEEKALVHISQARNQTTKKPNKVNIPTQNQKSNFKRPKVKYQERRMCISKRIFKQENQTTKLIYPPKTKRPIPNKEAKKKYQERKKDVSNIFHK